MKQHEFDVSPPGHSIPDRLAVFTEFFNSIRKNATSVSVSPEFAAYLDATPEFEAQESPPTSGAVIGVWSGIPVVLILEQDGCSANLLVGQAVVGVITIVNGLARG